MPEAYQYVPPDHRRFIRQARKYGFIGAQGVLVLSGGHCQTAAIGREQVLSTQSLAPTMRACPKILHMSVYMQELI